MKLDRVMIAAPKSGSGKTTITCALLQSLKEQGIPVVSYKCGPDSVSYTHLSTGAEWIRKKSGILLKKEISLLW